MSYYEDNEFHIFPGGVSDGSGASFNVGAFGAVGDGTTDSTTSINAAVAAASVGNGGNVIFPPGTYLTTGIVITDARIGLIGAGSGQEDTGAATPQQAATTTIKSTTNAPIIKYTTATRSDPKGRFSRVAHLGLVGSTSAGTSQHGLQVDNRGLTVEDVSIQQCGGNGVYLTDSVSSVFDAVRVWDCFLDGWHMDDGISPVPAAVTQNTLTGCSSIANARDGLRCNRGGSGNAAIGFLVEGNTGFGIKLLGTSPSNLCRFNRFLGTWDELNAGGTVFFDAAGAQDNWIDYVRYASGAPDYQSGFNNQNIVSGVNFGAGVPGDTTQLFLATGGYLVPSNGNSLLTVRNRDNSGLGKLVLSEFYVGGTSASFPGLFNNGARMLCKLADFSAFADLSVRGLMVAEGANAKMGTAVLIGGTVAVSTTAVSATSRIYLTSQVDGGAPGFLRVSARTPATSFTVTSSSGTDTSTVAWMIVEPA